MNLEKTEALSNMSVNKILLEKWLSIKGISSYMMVSTNSHVYDDSNHFADLTQLPSDISLFNLLHVFLSFDSVAVVSFTEEGPAFKKIEPSTLLSFLKAEKWISPAEHNGLQVMLENDLVASGIVK